LLAELLKYLDGMPSVSKPNQVRTKIDRLVILDELEMMCSGDGSLYTALGTTLTQAASKATCMIPVFHHFAKEQRHVVRLCENRIIHQLQADDNNVHELLMHKPGQSAPLFDIEGRLPNLEPGTCFVSFLDDQLKRLSAMHVEVTRAVIRKGKAKETNHAKKRSRKR